MRSEQSSRTLTFLFSDLESSTRLWEDHPQAMRSALERHDAFLRDAVESANGQVVKSTGDGLMAVFASALDGVQACLAAQHNLQDAVWGETGPLKVRMGLHAGEAHPRGGDFYGPAVNRAARLMSAAHGGQVLLSAVAAALVADLLPDGATLRDLGEHRLKDLARPEHIFQLLHPQLQADFPPLHTLDTRPNNLPAQPTPLIGREKELREIRDLLGSEEVRLLTLTGPGGTGKTRLGLQAAAESIDRFADGVYFVDLSPIRDPGAVLTAIAKTLGTRETADRPLIDELKSQLGPKALLLLLDNFEQVTTAAPQVSDLLGGCSQLKILVTSREALRVRSEHLYPVSPLALPKPDIKRTPVEQLTQYEAVRLFIERARAVKPDFQVNNENAPAVAEICVHLDGLPLAIELAAARVRLFPPQALLERLGSSLKLLSSGARDVPLRQQTMRDAIAWSYDLLNPGEKLLFQLLSAFSGGCSFDAVESAASTIKQMETAGVDILDGLTSLVEKSLVRQVEQMDGEPRFLILETIREYAAERLAEDPAFLAAARRAQAGFYTEYLHRKWAGLNGHRPETAQEALVAEIDNIRTAWRYWVEQRDLDQLNTLVDSLWSLYHSRGWYLATIDLSMDMLEVLSKAPSTPERVQQKIMLQTSLARALLIVKGYTSEVEHAYKRALELSETAGEIPQTFPVLRGLGSLYGYLNQYDKALPLAEKLLHLGESLNDNSIRVEGQLMCGYLHAFGGEVSQGLSDLDKAITGYDPSLYRAGGFRLGNDPGVVGLNVSALLLWMKGFPDQAILRANKAVDLAHQINHPYSLAYAFFHISYLHLWRREAELVRDRSEDVLKIAEEHQFLIWKAVATCLHGAAIADMGQAVEGLAQVIQGINQYQGLHTPPTFWPLLLHILAWTYHLAGDTRQAMAALDQALDLFPPESIDIISGSFYLSKGRLLLALSPDHAGEAEAWYNRALISARELGLLMLELHVTVALCRLYASQGRRGEGLTRLRQVVEKFSEGFDTRDLREAQELLEE